MTNKSRTFLPIAARLRQGIPVVFYGDGQGGFRSTFHDQQAAEAIETLVAALDGLACNGEEPCRVCAEVMGAKENCPHFKGRAALEKVRAMK